MRKKRLHFFEQALTFVCISLFFSYSARAWLNRGFGNHALDFLDISLLLSFALGVFLVCVAKFKNANSVFCQNYAAQLQDSFPYGRQSEFYRLIKKNDIVSLRSRLEKNDINKKLFNSRSTLLMLVAFKGNIPMGEFLISRGADVNYMNPDGETALSNAVHGGHVAFVKLLLSHNASLECRPMGHSLKNWVTKTSGLSKKKMELIFSLLNAEKSCG